MAKEFRVTVVYKGVKADVFQMKMMNRMAPHPMSVTL